MIRLTAVIELEGQAPRALTHESNARTVIIGRDPSADFQVPLTTISRHHSRISETDNVYVIEDMGSTHGTVLNGRKLDKGEKKVVRDGDIIELTHARITCTIEKDKVVSNDLGEGTQAIAARAIDGILGRLGEAKGDDAFVRAITGPDEGQKFVLAGPAAEWTMGRSKDCEIVLNDPNVSRRHATIRKDWNGFTVHDLGSKNGVLLNDRRIAKARRLEHQDEITVGPVKLVFFDPNADLMAALRDVPGFEVEDVAEELDAEQSVMGAPEQAQPGEHDGFGAGSPYGGPLEGSQARTPMLERDDEYAHLAADLDPMLLEDPSSKFPFEWLLVAGGIILLGAAGVSLFLIL